MATFALPISAAAAVGNCSSTPSSSSVVASNSSSRASLKSSVPQRFSPVSTSGHGAQQGRRAKPGKAFAISVTEKNAGIKDRGTSVCNASKDGKNGYEKEEEVEYDENGFDESGYDKNGRDKFGRDRQGLDEEGFDKYGVPGEAFFIGPVNHPEYITYIDPIKGEPSPTYGVRPPLPNAAFWGEDLEDVQKYASNSPSRHRAGAPAGNGNRDESEDGETSRAERGWAGRKRKKKGSAAVSSSGEEELTQEEIENRAKLKILADKFRQDEESGTFKTMARVMKDSENEEKAGKSERLDDEDEEEEEKDESLGLVLNSPGYALTSREAPGDVKSDEPDHALKNDELWWNWQQPKKDEQAWSKWQKRPGDSDSVMAAAMAETGQIKLFGEKPTIAEATLARARKHVFYEERMSAEEQKKVELGALGYYKEWVKGYKGDTSKEAVQKRFEETGEEEGLQLLDMFAFQTLQEYQKMRGTDIRIRRDPLVMRMRPEQIKQVWGGDPVYPTINYEQDPDTYYDYRNENMHEPIPDILEVLRATGRLKTQAEMKAILEKEKLEDEEYADLNEMSGIVETDEEEDYDEEYEIDIEMQALRQAKAASSSSKNGKPSLQISMGLDDIDIDAEVDVAEVNNPDEDMVDDET